MIDYAARRFREEVAAWPDGVYEADAYVDHDPLGNPDIHLHVKITVDGEQLDDRLHRQRHPRPSSRRGRPSATPAATRSARSPR